MVNDPDLIFLNRLQARGHWGIKRGLDNPRALIEGLGHPDRAFPAVLIAGTNGKGSTGAFLANALRAAGLRVGWTTSPHLVSPGERIWLDGAFLDEPRLNSLLGEVFAAEASVGIQATYFELMIAAALLAFQRAEVDIALVEVGLGGRWDATNTLDPILTVLTNVALDHTQILGSTREAIAREKLCTARTGRPLVLGPSLDSAWIRPLMEVEPALHAAPPVVPDAIAWDHSVVSGHRVGLAGRHQLDNLATAFEALRQLRSLGFNLPEDAVWRGISETRWPGRLWAVPGLENVWADGAHNPDGARVLAQHAMACGMHPHIVFAVMADKDFSEMAEALRRMEPASITLVHGEDERYARAQALQSVWGPLPVLNLGQAAEMLRCPAESPRLVTGSLFFIGDLLRTLGIQVQA